jgi:hypothetical protein
MCKALRSAAEGSPCMLPQHSCTLAWCIGSSSVRLSVRTLVTLLQAAVLACLHPCDVQLTTSTPS